MFKELQGVIYRVFRLGQNRPVASGTSNYLVGTVTLAISDLSPARIRDQLDRLSRLNVTGCSDRT